MKYPFSSGVAKAAAGLTGVQLIAMAMSLVTGPIQARELGPDLRGQLATILIIGQLGSFLSDFGAIHWVTRSEAQGRRTGATIGAVVPMLLAASAVALALAWPVARLAGSGTPVLFALVFIQMAIIPLCAIIQVGSGVALGRNAWRVIARIRLIVAVVPFIGIITLWALEALTLVTAAACYFVATILSAWPAVRLWWNARPIRTDRAEAKDAWQFGRTSWLNTLLNISNVRADGLIVAAVLDFRALGIYVVAATFAMLPAIVPGAVTQAVSRRVATDDLGPFTAMTIRLVLLSGALAAAAIAIVAPVIVPMLFGQEFDESVAVLWILLCGTVIGSAAQLLGNAVTLAGRPATAAFAQGLGLLAMVSAMIALSSQYGVRGAAAGSATGYAVTLSVLLWYAHRRSGVPLTAWVIARPSDFRVVFSRHGA